MKTAVCMIVRNEERDIAEWLAYHILVGFDTIIVFDNNSTDRTAKLIQASGRLHDVRYHHWGRTDADYQVSAYFTACHIYRHEFRWIAFIDSDEFIVPTRQEPINTMLERYEPYGALGVNWAIYGSSGYETHPPALITEALVHRSVPDFFANRHIKSVVRPINVLACSNPHWFDVDCGYFDLDGRLMEWFTTPDGHVARGLTQRVPDYAACRVNHYYVRSRAHWLEKIARGYSSDIAVRRLDEFEESDRNDVHDDAARRFDPKLKVMTQDIINLSTTDRP